MFHQCSQMDVCSLVVLSDEGLAVSDPPAEVVNDLRFHNNMIDTIYLL